MPETEVRCTCTDWTVSVGCPVHGCPRQPILSVNLPEGTMVTLPGEAMQQVVRDGPDGMLMLHPAEPLGEKAVNVVRRMLTRWLQRPELRDVIMEVVKEDVKRRGPGPIVVTVAPTGPYDPAAVGWTARRITREEAEAMWPSQADPPLIVRATPEQRRALLDCRWVHENGDIVPGPKHLGIDPASGPDLGMRCVSRRLPNGMLVIDEITPVLSDAVWAEMAAKGTAEAVRLEQSRAARPDCRCELCGWEGDAKALALGKALPRRGRECLCPRCLSGDRIVDLEYEDEPVVTRPAMFAQRPLECRICGWRGVQQSVYQTCPSCSADAMAAMGPIGCHAQDRKAALASRLAGIDAEQTAIRMSAVIGTIRTPPAKASVVCGSCGKDARANSLRPYAGTRICDPCFSKSLAVLGPAGCPPDPAAPVAACTAHVTAAPAAKAPDLHCTECEWEGNWEDLTPGSPGDPAATRCPGCNRHSEDCMGEGPLAACQDCAQNLAAASPLDQAIRGSTSLDPGGDRKPAEQLLVETPDQAEARRKVDAERIANIMKGGVL